MRGSVRLSVYRMLSFVFIELLPEPCLLFSLPGSRAQFVGCLASFRAAPSDPIRITVLNLAFEAEESGVAGGHCDTLLTRGVRPGPSPRARIPALLHFAVGTEMKDGERRHGDDEANAMRLGAVELADNGVEIASRGLFQPPSKPSFS